MFQRGRYTTNQMKLVFMHSVYIYIYIEWASARVPPTPLPGGGAEGGWSISNPVTSQIFERETWFLSTQLAPT